MSESKTGSSTKKKFIILNVIFFAAALATVLLIFSAGSSSDENEGTSVMKSSKGDSVDLEDLRADSNVDIENPPPTVTEDVVVDKPIFGEYETMKWPECMAGLTGEQCKQYIEKTSPDLKGNVFIIEPGMFVTEDFRLDRVRIYIDKEGMCTLIPERG